MKINFIVSLCTFIVVVLFSFIGTYSFGQKYVVLKDTLNIWENPTDSSDVLGEIFKSDTVNVVSEEGNWCKIKFQEKDGYVIKQFIQEVTIEEIPDNQENKMTNKPSEEKVVNSEIGQKYIVQPDKLNIRLTPNDNSEVIGNLLKGDIINVIGSDGDWFKINLSGIDGYIHKDFVKEVTESGQTKTETKKGFTDGFSKGFGGSIIYVLVLIGTFVEVKNRISDQRYKKGYRDGPLSFPVIKRIVLYSGVISILIGLVTGIVFWFQSF